MKVLGYISLLFFSFNCLGQINFVKKSFYFDSGISLLNSKQKATIDSLLKVTKHDSISLVGYTDSIGNQKYNLALATKRCVAVRDEISKIDTSVIITYLAKGENSHSNSLEWQKRRVEITIYTIEKDHKTKKIVQSPIVQKNIISATKSATGNIKPIPPKQIFSDLFLSSDKIVVENLQFEAGSNRFLHDKAPNELFYLADLLKKQPTLQIEIVGHVCCINDKKLSVDRAKKVETFLRSKGVPKKQMTHKGMSNTVPLVKEITKEDQQKNRRVEILILER